MEKDSRARGYWVHRGQTPRKGEGVGCTRLTSPTYPEAQKGEAFSTLEPGKGSPESRCGVAGATAGGEWPAEGARPLAWEAAGARGARGARAAPRLPAQPAAQPAALAGAARPRSSARCPRLLPPPGCSCRRAGGAQGFVPASSPSLRAGCAPAPRGPQSAQRRSLRIAAFYCFLTFLSFRLAW
ncbi:circumsporozoite protein-like [Canis lupus dingo]|uniref:circumsporozoite protein-like n=1 Tax=Canis lupus dingo TaxID=286419 RepID=UPI000DC6C492|nr:circumsporozoite protein-like [Canis lupus dingo]